MLHAHLANSYIVTLLLATYAARCYIGHLASSYVLILLIVHSTCSYMLQVAYVVRLATSYMLLLQHDHVAESYILILHSTKALTNYIVRVATSYKLLVATSFYSFSQSLLYQSSPLFFGCWPTLRLFILSLKHYTRTVIHAS